MTKRVYGRYIDYIDVASETVMVEIRVLESEIEINGEKVLTDKWLLPEHWQEVFSVLREAARKHIKHVVDDNVLKILGKSVRIVLNFDTFLPTYQNILKPYKSNIYNLEECLNNSGSDWFDTCPYKFMLKAVVSPVNFNFSRNSLSASSYTSESDADKRMKNNTEFIDERNIEDTQVLESDNELNTAMCNKLSTSFTIPESDSDNSLPDYSQLNLMFDSQDMCCIDKISKYTGLPSRQYIHKENISSSQCDNNDNLSVISSQALCLNDEKIATKSKSSKRVRSAKTLFGSSFHCIGESDFQSKGRKTTAVEALNVVNTSSYGDRSSLKISKRKITYSPSKELKGNENEVDTLLKRAFVKSDKNRKKKCKVHNFNKSQETKTASYSPEKSLEVNEQHDKKISTTFNSGADQKKSRIFRKKKCEGNSVIKNYFPKILSPENTRSTVEKFTNEEYVTQMPDFMQQPVYQKCKSSSLEKTEYSSLETKKHSKLNKNLIDKSENNPSKLSHKKAKACNEKLSRKVKEKLCLNTTSSTGPCSKNIQSYFSPNSVSTKQSVSSKCSRKENVNTLISYEKMNLPRSSVSNKCDLEEMREITNTVEEECMHHVSHSSGEHMNSPSENVSIKTKKKLKLSKALRTKSEDSVDIETKCHQRPKRKLKEKSDLNTRSKVGSSSKNIQSYFSPNSLNTDQSILGKCARKENLNSHVSPENISVPKLSNKNNFGETEKSANCFKKVLLDERRKLAKDQSPNKCSKTQNEATVSENNEVCSEIMKERKKYRVAHLSLEEIESEYAKHKNHLTDIFTGKLTTWRQEEFCKGGPHSRNLCFSVSTIPFTDKQLHHLLILMRKTVCRKRNFVLYFDYFMKVLLPEVTTRIFMDKFSLSHDEVVNKLNQLYISTSEPLMFGT